MINLEEHTIEVDGIKYIPLEVAKAAISEGLDTTQLDNALDLIKSAMVDIKEIDTTEEND